MSANATHCRASVHHGRMGMFPCQNPAGPSGFCRVHDKEAKAAQREALTRAALSSPTVDTRHSVRVTVSASLAWPKGAGPRAVVPYTDKVVELRGVTVSRSPGEQLSNFSHVIISATRVKKDGTLGAPDDGSHNWRWGALPPEVREVVADALSIEEAKLPNHLRGDA